MAFSKAENFKLLPVLQARLAKAICHPARITVLTHLYENGKSSFKDIAENIPLARPTISQHMRILRDTELVIADQEPPNTFYELNTMKCEDYFICMEKLVAIFLKE
jgi:DNA-binding transcriptional ArsR family regulator